MFVEDYDMHVAHYLVQGWTSGSTTRAAARGQRHQRHEGRRQRRAQLSILDGWWHEGYAGGNGWLIDPGVDHADPAAQDAADAEALYRILENEVVPAFYERDEHEVPRRWVQMVKQSIRTVAPRSARDACSRST